MNRNIKILLISVPVIIISGILIALSLLLSNSQLSKFGMNTALMGFLVLIINSGINGYFLSIKEKGKLVITLIVIHFFIASLPILSFLGVIILSLWSVGKGLM